MLEDVQRKDCVTFVDQVVGLGNSDIIELFEAADTNGDGIVMRSELGEDFQSLALQRSGGSESDECHKNPDNGEYSCAGYKMTTCCGCKDCKCPDDCSPHPYLSG